MNKIEVYSKNQRKAKFFTVSAPIVFWGLLILAVLFFIFTLKNSVGNVNEITSLLNSKRFTGEELRANYIYLTDKYGEWVIGNGNSGFQIKFIDVKNAIFSGVAITTGILSIVCFVGAWVLGKWLFPAIVNRLTQNNQDMVNLTVLKMEDKGV